MDDQFRHDRACRRADHYFRRKNISINKETWGHYVKIYGLYLRYENRIK